MTHNPPAERAGTEPATDEPTRESTPLFYAVSRDLRAQQQGQDAASATRNEAMPGWPGACDDHDPTPPASAEQQPAHEEHAQASERHEIRSQPGRPHAAPMWTDPDSVQGHMIPHRLRRLHAIDVDGPWPTAEALTQLAAWWRSLASDPAQHPAQARGWLRGAPRPWTVVGIRVHGAAIVTTVLRGLLANHDPDQDPSGYELLYAWVIARTATDAKRAALRQFTGIDC